MTGQERERLNPVGACERCDLCRSSIAWASWWYPQLGLYLCDAHADQQENGSLYIPEELIS